MPPAIDLHAEPSPRQFRGVAVSSTFEDLKEHRDALIDILTGHRLFPLAMEHDSARPGADVIDSSLQKVRDGAAYVGIISRRYGQVPPCSRRNPDNRSITELEFDEAQRLGRPILLFLMGDAHPVREADVELDPENRKKLQSFRERAKQMAPDAPVHRVYDTFNSLEQFKEKAARAVAELERYLQAQASIPSPAGTSRADMGAAGPALRPVHPAFYAEPPYIGSHPFVGRQAELDRLNDWAASADPHPVLLFEAIGGTGKSMLTWEWTTKHATGVRGDWSGRFWYSFYEKGAIMADFCRRALVYITGRPLDEFRKKKTPELAELLLRELEARPWLLVLDGLERVLVAYHRFDAAQVPDEEAGTSDQIARRDPCDAIRPEDDELLRMLAAAAPSKLLLTSRLTPRVLLNQASQPIPGVLRVPLPGLRPRDAEALLRSCGITGSSPEIQNYLNSHCDCHPLVTGVLAGLINDYLPDRGNFDAWAADPTGGGQLNLASLDLVQKRNHILHAAIDALPDKSRELLLTLALLSQAVDYPLLCALDPHSSDAAVAGGAAEVRSVPGELALTVRDLERRGLVQYDRQAKRYDLHPVVRGVAAGGLAEAERNRFGQRVVDHFSQQSPRRYDQVESLDDLRPALEVVRTLLQMRRFREASGALSGDLAFALDFNLEANAEILALLHPFFPDGWGRLPAMLDRGSAAVLADYAGSALLEMRRVPEALAAHGASLLADLKQRSWENVCVSLSNLSALFLAQNRLAKQALLVDLTLRLAEHEGDDELIFGALVNRFRQAIEIGQTANAERAWPALDAMGRDWPRNLYLPGEAEVAYATLCFHKNVLTEIHLTNAESLAVAGKSRAIVRELHRLRGMWYAERQQWSMAAEAFHEAVRMARAVGQVDELAETYLALARFRAGKVPDPRRDAERLPTPVGASHYPMADLWSAMGDVERAQKHALAAYRWAWADGEPYVHRYELDKARDLLGRLGVDPPDLPPYDRAQDQKLPWEDEVIAAIEQRCQDGSDEVWDLEDSEDD